MWCCRPHQGSREDASTQHHMSEVEIVKCGVCARFDVESPPSPHAQHPPSMGSSMPTGSTRSQHPNGGLYHPQLRATARPLRLLLHLRVRGSAVTLKLRRHAQLLYTLRWTAPLSLYHMLWSRTAPARAVQATQGPGRFFADYCKSHGYRQGDRAWPCSNCDLVLCSALLMSSTANLRVGAFPARSAA